MSNYIPEIMTQNGVTTKLYINNYNYKLKIEFDIYV